MVVALNHVSTPFYVIQDQTDPVTLGRHTPPGQEEEVAKSIRDLVSDHGAAASVGGAGTR